jgi:SAM-dependent methyltransferase
MIPLLILTLILLVSFVVLLLLPPLSGQPWVPANEDRIHRALELAALKPGEVLFDLGSGDGRVLVAAAQDFGARAVGVELSPLLFALAWVKIQAQGLQHKISLHCGSFYQADIHDANVVYLYLTRENANRLRSKLELEMKPGARVVSVISDLEGWTPAGVDRDQPIFLYTSPLKIH